MSNMLQRDSDGFVTLKPKDGITISSLIEKHKVKRDPNVPTVPADYVPKATLKYKKGKFKKGSWKRVAYKKLCKSIPGRNIKDFHFTRLTNFAIYRKNEPKVIAFSESMKYDDVKKLSNKYPDAIVLINIRNNIYREISLKSYLKLAKIDKIYIDEKVYHEPDGWEPDEDEDTELYEFEKTSVVHNINDLFSLVTYTLYMSAGINDLQARCLGYDWFEYRLKLMVATIDGKVKPYKTWDDFAKDYKVNIYDFRRPVI